MTREGRETVEVGKRERVREREIEANPRLKEDKRKRQVDKQERETEVSGPPLRRGNI